MSANGSNNFLNIEDANLRVRSGSVHAQGMTIGGITVGTAHGLQSVTDTSNTTSNTLQFTNATTAFKATSNIELTSASKIIVDSNVVTEYTGPHDRPLRKYPEVYLTSATTGGYTASQSSEYDTTGNFSAWKAFDSSEAPNGTLAITQSSQYNNTSGTLVYAGDKDLLGDSNYKGEWIKLELPISIAVKKIHLQPRTTFFDQTPCNFKIVGSNDNSSWDVLYHNNPAANTTIPSDAEQVHHMTHNLTKYYKYVALVANTTGAPISGNYMTMSLTNLEFYGHEEGSGSLDTTLKTVFNVPATTGTQLEVYYDGRETSSYTGSGTTVYDISPNTNNGTLNGGVGFDSTYKAFTFDGVDDYIEGDLNGITNGQWAHTMSFWFKLSAKSQSTFTYIAQIGKRGTNGQGTLVATRNNLFSFGVWGDSRIETNIEPILGEWYHISAVYSGGVFYDNATLYINGTGYDKNNGSTGSIRDEGDPLTFLTTGNKITLGKQMDVSSDYVNGSIANFRLYSKALNAGQVQELYDYQKDVFLESKSQLTIYKGHLGVGVTEPSGQLELAGDERLQQYPPRSMTGYETLVEGHGVFCVYASTVRNSYWEAWEAFNGDTSDDSRWISLDTYTGTEDTYSGGARLYSSAPLGEYVVLKLPYPIKLSSARVYGKSGSPDSNNQRQGPERGQIWGSNDGVTWEHVINYDFGDYQQAQWNEINNINSTKYYSQYGFIVTKKLNNTYTAGGATQGDYVAVTEIQYFGAPGPTALDKGSLSLTRSLDVPRVSRYDVDTETPRPEKLVVDFDTTVNSSPTDISGKGNHGTFYGDADYSAADKAFEFDGSGDYIQGDTGLTGNFSHSISMWFNANSNNGQLFWTGINTSGGGERINVLFSASGGNGGNTTTPQIHYTFKHHTHYVDVNANQWHHLVCTYDGTNSTGRKIYLDGVQAGSDTITDGSGSSPLALYVNDSTFYINKTDYGNSTLVGKISNFKFYNVTLEPSEIRKLYNLGRTGRSMVVSDTAVGIGKAPEAQLDVRGNLRVGGTIQVPLIISHRWINADTSVSSGAYIPYNSVLYENPPGIHSGTIFTCPVKGIYECHFASMTDNDATYTGSHEWYINGTYTSPRRRGYAFNALGSVHKMAASHYYIHCNSGDTIGVTSAGAQTWYGSSTYSHSHMSIRLMTPT